MSEFHKKTLLLLEDDDVLRRYLAKLLRADQYVVQETETVATALAMVKTHAIDLIIADLKLPDDTAIGLIRRLAHENRRIPVLIITAYGEWETYLEALDLGVLDYLNKPIEYTDLREKIESLLGKVEQEYNGQD
ncbi:MAG: response regulator [Candidatus Omnitrophica bacterium]|nr:response regulator [Candidatus Omnitrophota bacterium]